MPITDTPHLGAIVEVIWPRAKIDARETENAPLITGQNTPITA
ncbi:MAG: hypothetical protein AAFY52_08735 [Pseudomonadota bacterium]